MTRGSRTISLKNLGSRGGLEVRNRTGTTARDMFSRSVFRHVRVRPLDPKGSRHVRGDHY